VTTRWAILTGEYPPQFGGVGDYTRQVAAGLAAAGDAVTVYAPRCDGETPADDGVAVRRLSDHFGPRGLLALDAALARRPDRVLVQYVPHAYGWKAMNLPFAAWVAGRAGRAAPVWVMFHEVALPFGRRPAHAALAAAHAVMARLVAGAADRVFVSVPGWAPLLRRFAPRAKPAEWLPVPSNVPAAAGCVPRAAGGFVIGHFGTYGPAVAPLLEPALARLLAGPTPRSAVLVGRGAGGFRAGLLDRHPALAGRLTAVGELPAADVARHLRSCDVLLQPYIDGISSRRGTAMAGLANGVPVVSNLGAGSEPLWAAAGCVGLAPTPDPVAVAAAAEAVLALPADRRAEMGRAGADLYRARFSLENTVRALRAAR
jgi:glycosyltransferase involved in cell wall biosynthesis